MTKQNTALASGSGDHAELARLAEAAEHDPEYDGRSFEAAANPATVLALLAEIAALRSDLAELREHRITADLLVSSLKSDLAEAGRNLAEAREIIQHLEWSCEQLAATRSQAAYDQMISDGQAQALLELDNSRRAARALISKEAERG